MAAPTEKGSLEELKVWQRAMDLVDAVYRLTKSWPREEVFGLTNQVRRAAVSVPSNIADGHGRKCDGDFLRFLSISIRLTDGSKNPIANRGQAGLCQAADAEMLFSALDEVARMLNGLRKSIEDRKSRS